MVFIGGEHGAVGWWNDIIMLWTAYVLCSGKIVGGEGSWGREVLQIHLVQRLIRGECLIVVKNDVDIGSWK